MFGLFYICEGRKICRMIGLRNQKGTQNNRPINHIYEGSYNSRQNGNDRSFRKNQHAACSEMEFMNGILSRGLGISSSLLRLEVFLVFCPHFSVLQNAIHE
jgi:hypothetical protein